MAEAKEPCKEVTCFPLDKEESIESASPVAHTGQSYQMAHKAGERGKKKRKRGCAKNSQ